MPTSSAAPNLKGQVASGFEPVRDTFCENFSSGEEIGAGVALWCDNKLAVDLYAGPVGPNRTAPMTDQTLLPVYSVTKGISALVVAVALHLNAKSNYSTPIAAIWPEFAAQGKHSITIGQFMSHQAGLVGFAHQVPRDIWADPPSCARALANERPLWPLGETSGYHPVTWGYVVGEIVARLTGTSVGTLLRKHFTARDDSELTTDFHIGLPESEHQRCGRMRRPSGLPEFDHLNQARHLAFVAPWNRHSMAEKYWRSIEIPSTNGHGTARALARLWSVYATGGRLDGQQIVPTDLLDALTEVQIAGRDRVLTFPVAFAAGVMVNQFGLFGPEKRALAHPGWGGALGLADPVAGFGFGYIPNRQSALLGCDPRADRLLRAVYACV